MRVDEVFDLIGWGGFEMMLEFVVADDDGDCDRGREKRSEDIEGSDGTSQLGPVLRRLRG